MNDRDTGTMFPNLPRDEAESVFYDIVDEHACNIGVDSVLTLVRDWLEQKALDYAPGTGHRTAYVEASTQLDIARGIVMAGGAEKVECSPLPQVDTSRQPGNLDDDGDVVEEPTQFGDGT